jgi:hypothetical protein
VQKVRTWNFILPPPQPPAQRGAPASPTDARAGLKGVSPSLLHAFDVDPRSIMRRRSSLVVDDLPPEMRAALQHRLEDSSVISEDEGHAEPNGVNVGALAEEKRMPTQFQEPDPNSLLDAFGF